MKKILVIFTGGTIGSKKTNNTINVDDSSSYYLLKTYNDSEYKRDVSFITNQPLNILSEDMIPNDWLIINRSISKIPFSDFDGIIITHGTDTLPFTSSAVSYLSNYVPIPIVLTASNYPLEDLRSNGLRNFASAVDFILDQSLPGVFVIFENNNGDSLVHLGTRLMQAAPFTNEFDSVNSIIFGKVENQKFYRCDHPLNPVIEELQFPRERVSSSKITFSTEIMYMRPHPGLDYNYFNFSNSRKPRAILHDLYHSGTACTRKTENYMSLVDFTIYCLSIGIDVYIAPIKNINTDLYLTSDTLIEYGAFPLQNISVEAALVKLMLAYGSFDVKAYIRDFVNGTALFFEYIQ